MILAAPAFGDEVKAAGGTVRTLDRMTDKVEDLHLATAAAGTVGRLTITLDECRYPQGEPGESIAHLTIVDTAQVDPVFKGWMSASSPALNPLDHPRYDVWLLQCDAPEISPDAPSPDAPQGAPAQGDPQGN